VPDPSILLPFFDRLLKVLGVIRDDDRLAETRKDEALSAIYAALNETKSYIERRRIDGSRDRSREFRIARLWHDASIPLRHFDPEFAELCYDKGNYWMQPEVWTDEYPYWFPDPPLADESARIGLWLLRSALQSVDARELRLLDVIRGQTYSLERHPLKGDEEHVFRARYGALIRDWDRLRSEYE
jgi:hypothetical protein